MPATVKIRLMAHLVAGYPTLDDSFTVAEALAAGGADILEVQFPFSDPSADGKPIQAACSAALESHMKVSDGFALVERIRSRLNIPVFIMTYGNLIYSMGVENFVMRAADAGAKGIIAPDLMPGSDEGLYEIGKEYEISIVPVITPQISPERLRSIGAEKPIYLYCALRNGITGDETILEQSTIDFLERVHPLSPVIMAGFGIHRPEQIEALAPHADVAVAGSVFVREIQSLIAGSIPASNPVSTPVSREALYEGVKTKAECLLRQKHRISAFQEN